MREVVREVAPEHLFHGHYHWAYRDELVFGDGHRVQVRGLDMDDTTMAANTEILDLPLPRPSTATDTQKGRTMPL